MKRLLPLLSLAGLLLAYLSVQAQEAPAAQQAQTQTQTQTQTPDALIRAVSTDVIDSVKADKSIQGGDTGRINALVDEKVMPHVDFPRMTAFAVGPAWRQATPEQKQRLQAEYKTLLIRTYAGALTQVRDQTVQLRPSRFSPEDTDVVVRTEVRGGGEPIQLDYRLAKEGAAWKIYDVNVIGVWLGQQYRNSFAQEINNSGIDGLISRLAERNKSGTKS